MTYVEQAVFALAQRDRSAGYQLVGRSPGVGESDARELAVWGPSHDSLLESGPDAVSFNFHPLPSGAHCISRSGSAGWEYGGRGGHRVYTQCLIVRPEVLYRFGNNPFALIRAAAAGGMFQVHERVPAVLDRLELPGGSVPVDQAFLARLVTDPGPAAMAALVQAAFDSPCLAVAGTPSATALIAGMLNCLPMECRTEFSFSTALKFSSRRPFRIVALSGDRAQQRVVAHHANVTVLELSENSPPVLPPLDGWARLIERVLATGQISFLGMQLSKRRFELAADDLSALGLQLLEDLDASEFHGDNEEREDRSPFRPPWSGDVETCDDEKGTCSLPPTQRAHAAHRQFEKSVQAATAVKRKLAAPAKTIEPASPEVLKKLEYLDNAVYEAICGQATALEQLRILWPEVLAELGDQLVAESREQYLRYALQIWEDCVEPDGIRDPARAVQALDVLCVLFSEP